MTTINSITGGTKTRASTASDDDTTDQSDLAMQLIELLNDDTVLAKFKKMVYPTDLFYKKMVCPTDLAEKLAEKIDMLNTHFALIRSKLDEKDKRIKDLEEKVLTLEDDVDQVQQNSRRANLQIRGLPERNDGEDTDEKV